MLTSLKSPSRKTTGSLSLLEGLLSNQAVIQPRKPGSLPTPGAATKTLVQAGHVTLSKIFCLVGWGKYQITCFHIQAIHFKCKERDVVVAKNNMNFLI